MENPSGKNDLEARTLAFSIAVVRLVSALPRNDVSSVVGRQPLRSATSIGANYREANRAESREDFIHKTAIAQKEAAETDYWLEICRQTPVGDALLVATLATEARELLAILTTINRKAKGR
ncbi:MAG: four helix bundle protein [Opitutaceae bacterium]|nr:four helix bundle protein [Opitutaceae bacterium]